MPIRAVYSVLEIMGLIKKDMTPREGTLQDSIRAQDTLDESTLPSGTSEEEKKHSNSESSQSPRPNAVQHLSGEHLRNERGKQHRVRRHRFQKGRYYLGLDHSARIKQHHDGSEHLLWSRVRSVLQEPFSEFLGTLVFTLILQGGLAQATLSVGQSSAPGGDGFGSYLTVPFL